MERVTKVDTAKRPSSVVGVVDHWSGLRRRQPDLRERIDSLDQ